MKIQINNKELIKKLESIKNIEGIRKNTEIVKFLVEEYNKKTVMETEIRWLESEIMRNKKTPST